MSDLKVRPTKRAEERPAAADRPASGGQALLRRAGYGSEGGGKTNSSAALSPPVRAHKRTGRNACATRIFPQRRFPLMR
jgi:hypothetical protein